MPLVVWAGPGGECWGVLRAGAAKNSSLVPFTTVLLPCTAENSNVPFQSPVRPWWAVAL